MDRRALSGFEIDADNSRIPAGVLYLNPELLTVDRYRARGGD
jgi:hypothetical protein